MMHFDRDLIGSNEQHACTALLNYELQAKAFADIWNLFQKNGIQFVPLKGILLRQYYAKPWMRECSDIDIYVDEKTFGRANELLLRNGYKRMTKCSHHVTYVALNGAVLELHFALADRKIGSKISSLLDADFAKALFCEHPEQTAEYYIYHLVHMLGHFLDGGCGKKFFADLWILNNVVEKEVRWNERIEELLGRLQLTTFNQECCKLSEHWFGDTNTIDYDTELEEYVLSGGDYGTPERKAAVNSIRQGSKRKYILKRLFPSLELMQAAYPILCKAPVLLPAMWIKRAVSLLSKGYLSQLSIEAKAAKNINQKDVEQQIRILRKLNICEIK